MKTSAIIGWLIFLLVWLLQCSPQSYNCEGYKNSPIAEIPARCINY